MRFPLVQLFLSTDKLEILGIVVKIKVELIKPFNQMAAREMTFCPRELEKDWQYLHCTAW